MSRLYPWRPSQPPLPAAFWEALPAATGFASEVGHFRPGDVFVALQRKGYDGHLAIPEIVQKQPAFIVVSDTEMQRYPGTILVADTALAHWHLAEYFRRKYRGTVIAVGGSIGKTSTKDFLFSLLSLKFKSIATVASQNCHVGVPRTLERLRDDVECAVIEIGIDGPGQMEHLARLVAPDIAILTPLAEEHLRQLVSLEGVVREELQLFHVTGHGTQGRGKLYCNEDEFWLRDLGDAFQSQLQIVSAPSPRLLQLTPHLPPAMQKNAHLATVVALDLGVPLTLIENALSQLAIPEGRGRTLEFAKSRSVICDHYNASPKSMIAALSHAEATAKASHLPLQLMLGDMLDLGGHSHDLHQALIAEIVRTNPKSIYLIGPEMAALADALKEALPEARVDTAESFDQASPQSLIHHAKKAGVHLLKGSRGMGLERALPYFET